MSHDLQSRATHQELVAREHAFERRLRRVPKETFASADNADSVISGASTASEVIQNARISKLALERAVSAAKASTLSSAF